MITPAQQHFEHVMAQRHGKRDTDPQTMTLYERMLARLRYDQSQLSAIQSRATRAERKRELLPAYDAWLDGVLSADTGQNDIVLITAMIWHLDAGSYDRAMQLAAYALKHRLPLPDDYRRTTATLLVDEMCDPTLTAFSAGQAAPASTAQLQHLSTLVDGHDMPDEVRAKLCKTLAFSLRNDGDESTLPEVLALLRRALTLHDGVGVKKDIETLERQLAKRGDDEKPAPKPVAKATVKKATTKKATASKAK